ncbi:hypothetical protein [Streptomyces sp. SM8]|jgi:chromosome segregation ATPase|uniref:hypothetical protein n=1 Tax=Streptomyces sp. SM8 TaxID=1195457 RepID=UPI000283110E|nr:hypothetical protein [Streptomyces sp. SM8]PKA37913.1 hypothetical protein SM8_029265 [Streptomyces sp. SM8]
MSDDLHERLAKALSESDGLPWSDAGPGSRDGYRADADALMPVIGDEMVRLRADRDRWEAIAGALEFERDELAAKHTTTADLDDEMVRLRADLLTAQRDRDTVFKELERERLDRRAEEARLRELLTTESLRANGAIAREESGEAHAETLEDELREMRSYAERMERERDNYRTAYASKPADVDDLKATIVSQAREIARLKGETA